MIFRNAKMSDVESIASLINDYADQNLMLPRTIPFIYQRIREYMVIEKDDIIIGVGALHVLWKDLAEICSLAIHPNYVGQGLGQKLVEKLTLVCRELAIEKLFTLTYQPDFFKKCGFTPIEKEKLPQKVWTECINCPLFPNCEEVALIKDLV
ncbi:N-acetyltransferase [Candidatus Contubernalis alkaliaceticus]|uniref:N-acetyltransferase n=1 Tax=Candidatus Contubernalis alkaliaceticus TaxID=338645 RepID=UPI001F4C423E|nr:N-acetyltransferase [Candidatus Contubernalis alkalaceticus]UNC91448.1 N-acetyltransferase [Candidatus Contubernalis alkalaceticus]